MRTQRPSSISADVAEREASEASIQPLAACRGPKALSASQAFPQLGRRHQLERPHVETPPIHLALKNAIVEVEFLTSRRTQT